MQRSGSHVLLSGVDLRILTDLIEHHSELGDHPRSRVALVFDEGETHHVTPGSELIAEILKTVDAQRIVAIPANGRIAEFDSTTSCHIETVGVGVSSQASIERLLCEQIGLVVVPFSAGTVPEIAIKAQAAGVRCLFTSRVPEESIVIPELARRVDHTRLVQECRHEARITLAPHISPRSALSLVARSPYNIGWSVLAMEGIYGDAA
jgi:hypothetical protein